VVSFTPAQGGQYHSALTVIRADLSYQHPIRTQTHACVDDLRIGNLGYIGTAFTLPEAHLPLIERIETEDRPPQ
jgi:hypothetical protein